MLTDADKTLADNLTISVEEAGAMLGMSRNGAYNAVRKGKIPSIRLGKLIRVPTEPLKKMLGILDEPPPQIKDDTAVQRAQLEQTLKHIKKALDALKLARAEAKAALERL